MMTQPALPTTTLATVSLFDARPFFEKALQFGIQNNIIDAQKLVEISTDAPKGIVQIARYFGSEYLRPELENARERIVNLVSLNLESNSGGDLQIAAESLRDHSFMSRSKGGADMLKALIVMPQNSHFGMNEPGGFTDEHIPLLAKWSRLSLPDYQAELTKRLQVAQIIDAARWLADDLGLDAAELEEAGPDAEAVIRTALLCLATRRSSMPDWPAFDKMVLALRKKYAPALTTAAAQALTLPLTLPKELPLTCRDAVQTVWQSVLTDLSKILDPTLATRKLFDQTPAFMGRYFWLENGLSEVDHHDRSVSLAWAKATGGHSDESSLLTLFLCLATNTPASTLLTLRKANALVRKVRKTGLDPELARQFIQDHAPVQHQAAYVQLWQDFLEEAHPALTSDFDYDLTEALALLRHECNIK
jgi:hypothetical protein